MGMRSYFLVTADGGKTWKDEAVQGQAVQGGGAAWCDSQGRCVNEAEGSSGAAEVVICDPQRSCVARPMPLPRLVTIPGLVAGAR